uniref:Uncharacterized protein n=1 Tax=Oryza glumipatula TaxID=40148 RepID=A0A0D9YKA7_9ORYZ
MDNHSTPIDPSIGGGRVEHIGEHVLRHRYSTSLVDVTSPEQKPRTPPALGMQQRLAGGRASDHQPSREESRGRWLSEIDHGFTEEETIGALLRQPVDYSSTLA